MEYLLFLSIITTHSLAANTLDYGAPNYFTNVQISSEDFQNYFTNIDGPNGEVNLNKNGDIKYQELLSLLHNEKSNNILLVRMSNKEEEDNEITDKEIEYPTRTKRDLEVINKNSTSFINDTMNNVEDTKRPKRQSVIKMLKNMFYDQSTTAPPKAKRMKPMISNYLGEHDMYGANSSFADLIVNLTETIKILNKNLANLKLHVNENEGFVMIKMPFSESYQNKQELNETEVIMTRPKREATDPDLVNITLKNETILENGQAIVNVKENSNTVSTPKPESTNKSSEVNNSRRDVAQEVKKSTDIGSKYQLLNNTQLVDIAKNKSANQSSIDQFNKTETNATSTTLKDKVTKNDITESKASQAILYRKDTNLKKRNKSITTVRSENAKTNNNNQDYNKNTKHKGIARMSVGREELLHFIEDVYNEIKDIILPILDVKEKYSAQAMYKIGYIVANLDTMDVTLKKLKEKLIIHKHVWGTKRLQKVFTKLNLSKHLVVNIMKYLNMYDRNPTIPS